MLKTLLTPFTTATAGGTVFRDIVIMVGSIIAILGALGILSQDQVDALRNAITQMTSPAVLLAFGTLATAAMSTYRAVFKSTSNRGAALAQETDAQIPKDDYVVVSTPVGQPDILVPPGGKQ